MACVLNPFSKDLDFLSPEDRTETHNLLHKEVSNLVEIKKGQLEHELSVQSLEAGPDQMPATAATPIKKPRLYSADMAD